jgi:hypothetical protein
MTTEPVHDDVGPTAQKAVVRTGLIRRIVLGVLKEAREAVLPTLFFFIGFNFIVLTTNLLVAQYLVAISSFMLATTAALVVGKAVLVTNNLPIIRLFDRGSSDPADCVQNVVLLDHCVYRASAGALRSFLDH